MTHDKRHVASKKGVRTIVIPLEDYRKMMADLEELESIRAYDAAKSSGERPVPFRTVGREVNEAHK